MVKHLLKQLSFLICLATIIVGLSVFLLNTETGLRAGFFIAAKIIPGKLTVKTINGRLLDRVQLTDFYFENKTVSVAVQSAEIKWKLKDLLLGKVTISWLHANNLKLQAKSIKPSKLSLSEIIADLQKIQLSSQLHFADVQLNNVILQQANNPSLTLNKISFESQFEGNNVVALKAAIQAQDAQLMLQGSLQKQWDLNWKLHFANLKQFLPQLQGQVDSAGSIIGLRNAPKIIFNIKIIDFKYGDYACQKFQGSVALDLAAKTKSSFCFAINSPLLSGVTLDKINVVGEIQPLNSEYAFNLNFGASTIYFNQADATQFFKLGKSTIHGTMNAQGLAAKAIIYLPQHDAINAAVQLPKLKQLSQLGTKQPLTGEVTWQSQNLAFLQQALPNIKNLKGLINVKYTLSGTLQNPKFLGKAEITNASFIIPELNINPHAITLKAQHVDNKITYQGVVTSGSGILNLTGETLLATNSIQSKIKLNGSNFLVANTPEYKVIASSQLTLQTKKDLYELHGKIFIPQATIKPKDSSSMDLPAEVVFVKKAQPQPTPTFPLTAHLQLDLGDAVNIDVMDLKARVEGHLQITDEPKKIATAVGTLYSKNGSYTLYGQQLQVTDGTLHFLGGAVTNPQVNVQAVRDFKAVNTGFSFGGAFDQELIVGIKMSGTLDNLRVDLFSIPSGLSKSDILSYLVIGQPSEQASGAKAQLLLQAASAFNFGGTNEIKNLIGKLQQKLGLSEFGLGSETHFTKQQEIDPTKFGRTTKPGESLTTNTAFVLGKFLTPRIYIGYSMGLLDPVSIFRVKYFMGRHWSIQTQTSTLGNGGDIMYTVESN